MINTHKNAVSCAKVMNNILSYKKNTTLFLIKASLSYI